MRQGGRWRPHPLRVPLVVAGLAVLGCSSALRAQEPSAGSSAPHPDSAEIRASAHDAQRAFERARVRHLPRIFGSSGGECDDIVGRMCWRHGPGSYWLPEAEDARVAAARRALIDTLDVLGARLPGDGWIVGQRVWYRGESGDWEGALGAARRCGAAPWWCAALRGLALHGLGRYPSAEAAFDSALAAAGPDVRERWRDLHDVLDGDARDLLEEDPELRGLLWRWADPLYLVPGNDRWTEHRARWTVATLRRDAYNPHGLSWGDDLRELLVRYGWTVGWERTRRRIGSLSSSSGVIGREHPESRAYLPPGRLLRVRDAPTDEGADDLPWAPHQSYTPSAYAPLYAPTLLPMTSQVARFPRRDSAVVVASYRLPRDTTRRRERGRKMPHELPAELDGAPLQAGLYLVERSGPGAYGQRVLDREEGAVRVAAPPGEYLVSVESWDPQRGLAGRQRLPLRLAPTLPDVATLSDLLFLRDGPEPRSLEEAVPLTLPAATVRAASALRVAWEVTGLGFRRETLEYSVTLEREGGGGVFGWIGRTLGLSDEDPDDRLTWSEPAPETTDPVFRAVRIELPDVDPGRYRLAVQLRMPGRAAVVSERVLEVEAPDGG